MVNYSMLFETVELFEIFLLIEFSPAPLFFSVNLFECFYNAIWHPQYLRYLTPL
jgi:hypothetical protein